MNEISVSCRQRIVLKIAGFFFSVKAKVRKYKVRKKGSYPGLSGIHKIQRGMWKENPALSKGILTSW